MIEPVKIGNALLYLGDCREIDVGPFDVVITDPPYGVNQSRGDGRKSGKIKHDLIPPDIRWIGTHSAIVWGGNNFCDQLPRSTGWLVWNKYHHEKSEHSQAEIAWSNVVKTVRLYSEAYHGFMRGRDGWFHPTQKPPGLMRWCLSFTDAETVFDPYMGSGTTGIACVDLSRKFIGIEIEEEYFDVACRRIEAAHAQGRLFA